MMFSTSLFYVFICLWLCGSDGVVSGFKIYRSKRDIFTNLKCTDDACTESQCSMYGAECVSEDVCKYCRCLEGRNTFMTSGNNQGECKRDEDVEPKSVPNEKFSLQNVNYTKCLKVDEHNSIIGTNCSSPAGIDMLWIWTGTNNRQLMNVKTLQCIERSRTFNGYQVKMRTCEKFPSHRQNLVCRTDTTAWEHIPWSLPRYWPWFWPWPKQSLNLAESGDYYYAQAGAWRNKHQWTSSKAQLCSAKTTYEGCYRFSDGSFMKYLNHSDMYFSAAIRAPIFQENYHYGCSVKQNIELSRDDQNWYTATRNFSATFDDFGLLELNPTELFREFNGTLLKIFVTCGTEEAEEHCVLFKLESEPSYAKFIITKHGKTTENLMSTKETFPSTLPTHSSNARRPTTTDSPQGGVSEERSESGGATAVAIAVTVALLMVVLVLGLLFYYRRRKRAQVPPTNGNDLSAVNYSKDIYEDPDRTYETLKGDENGVAPNQPGTSSDEYSYPDSNVVANPPSIEQEYTYAKETDFPRSSVGPKPEAKGQIQNGVVYETIDQPGQPDDDGFYNYPENTTIPKPPASELEYTYAKDTDFPRNTGEDRKIKGDGLPATATSNDRFYHTLESEEPVPNQQEYSYAQNTDIPSHRPGTQQNNDHSTPTENTGLYHTLEEPVPPPQLPVYSTLEESADDQK